MGVRLRGNDNEEDWVEKLQRKLEGVKRVWKERESGEMMKGKIMLLEKGQK